MGGHKAWFSTLWVKKLEIYLDLYIQMFWKSWKDFVQNSSFTAQAAQIYLVNLSNSAMCQRLGMSNTPQPWIFDYLVTKKSADARSSKSLYLSHNKYVKPTNIFKARLTGKIMATKVGKKQWSSSTYLVIHNKTTVGGFWLAAFVMGQI